MSSNKQLVPSSCGNKFIEILKNKTQLNADFYSLNPSSNGKLYPEVGHYTLWDGPDWDNTRSALVFSSSEEKSIPRVVKYLASDPQQARYLLERGKLYYINEEKTSVIKTNISSKKTSTVVKENNSSNDLITDFYVSGEKIYYLYGTYGALGRFETDLKVQKEGSDQAKTLVEDINVGHFYGADDSGIYLIDYGYEAAGDTVHYYSLKTGDTSVVKGSDSPTPPSVLKNRLKTVNHIPIKNGEVKNVDKETVEDGKIRVISEM